MSDHGIVTESGAIRFERLLPAPIGLVWDYLTRPELRARWLADGPMELRPGGRLAFTFRNGALSGPGEETPERFRRYEGISMAGEVLRCEPPRLLVHSWAEAWGSSSEVTYELAERGERTLLTLTHRRLRDTAALVDVGGGWEAHLAVLEDVLAGVPPRGFWAAHAAAEAHYRAQLGG